MLSFKLVFKCIEKQNETVTLCGIEYESYKCDIPGIKGVILLAPVSCLLTDGQYYRTNYAFLYGRGKPTIDLRVRISQAVEVVSSSTFMVDPTTVVKINGRFVTNSSKELKYIGESRTPCKAGVLLCKADTGRFSVYMCAFNENAITLQENGDTVYYDVLATLRKHKGHYELKVLTLKLV